MQVRCSLAISCFQFSYSIFYHFIIFYHKEYFGLLWISLDSLASYTVLFLFPLQMNCPLQSSYNGLVYFLFILYEFIIIYYTFFNKYKLNEYDINHSPVTDYSFSLAFIYIFIGVFRTFMLILVLTIKTSINVLYLGYILCSKFCLVFFFSKIFLKTKLNYILPNFIMENSYFSTYHIYSWKWVDVVFLRSFFPLAFWRWQIHRFTTSQNI